MSLVAWVIVAIACGASLLFLLNRPNLSSGQKLIVLLIFVIAGVPVGGLLFLVFAVAALWLFWDTGASDSLAFLFVTAPVAVMLGLLLLLIAGIADARETRKPAAVLLEIETQSADTGTLRTKTAQPEGVAPEAETRTLQVGALERSPHPQVGTNSNGLTGAELRGWIMAVTGFLLVVGVPLFGFILRSNIGLSSERVLLALVGPILVLLGILAVTICIHLYTRTMRGR
ncbi:MAG: hypothetical protein OXL37_16635 [Chloroflexota bacterium]|nr:hypothetical protein [Chloroflexota bacterium]MDE2960212.1 hypothetical protein [Chloroflexota bacterium]